MKKTLKTVFLILLTTALAVIFVVHTETVSDAVRQASHICADTVVPSLFPFLVLSSFMLNSGIIRTSGKALQPLAKAVFNLPGEAAAVILMGLIGGFPVGPKMTAQLYDAGSITKPQAQKMMLFTLNAGPAFVVGTIGFGMLGNTKVGALLYASMVFASVVTGIVVCMGLRASDGFSGSSSDNSTDKKSANDSNTQGNRSAPQNIGDALCASVESGTKSMFAVCAYIILFAAVTSAIGLYVKDKSVMNAVTALLEVTRGCKAYSSAAELSGLPVIAAILSFGGICVHCQVMDCVNAVRLPYGKFLAARFACAGLAALFCRTVLLLSPQEYQVFSNMASHINPGVSISFAACASLLLMAVLLVFDLDIKDEIC